MGRVFTRSLQLLIIGSMVASGCDRRSDEQGETSAEAQLLDEWRSMEARVRSMDRREGMRQADAYLTGVGLDALYALCAAPPTSAENASAMVSLLTAKLELDPVPAHTLAAWLGDADLSPICRSRVLRIAQGSRNDFTDVELKAISDALLDASLEPTDDEGERAPDWELSAAQFGSSDRVLARVKELLSRPDDASRVRGATLAGESTDPRVRDVLHETLQRVVTRPNEYADSAARIAATAGRVLGDRALPALERLAIEGGPTGLAAAVPALGYVRHPRALDVLLRAYGDAPPEPEAGADAFERAGRQRLYDATRRLEGYLRSTLTGRTPGDAGVAFALIDRASRYGPLVQPTEVVEALAAFRSRGAPGATLETVDAAIARLAR